MASYHCSVKTISRSSGRSSVASASYRAGVCLTDERTGEKHDYTKKQGVEHTELVLPDGVNMNREELWNSAEESEKRKNSTVAREYELGLPDELTKEQRQELVKEFATHLKNEYGVCADVAIHEPNKQGDQRNYHAHILTTTREVTAQGFGKKTRILDDKKTKEIDKIREAWANFENKALEKAGYKERVTHKSLENQGVKRQPTMHMGVTATAMARKGKVTDRKRHAPEPEASKKLKELEEQEQGMAKARQNMRAWQEEKAKEAEQARQWQEQALKLKQKQELKQEQERARQQEERQKARELERENRPKKERGSKMGR